jgi:predicted transposase YbfD/YdcC
MNWQDFFIGVEDFRVEGRCHHLLSDILMLTLIGVICDCDDFEQIADYGRDNEVFLKTFLELPNGVPSHDTLNRVFRYLDSEQILSCLQEWSLSIVSFLRGKQIVIDGKELRGTIPQGKKHATIRIVSAWVREDGISLSQQVVDSKSSEITAIPKLLETIDISGSVVTIDAIGCQRAIAKLIVSKSADYVLSLKKNQGDLYEQVSSYFNQNEGALPCFEERDLGHGRAELRKTYLCHDLKFMEETQNWEGLKSVFMVKRYRWNADKKQEQIQFYISSLANPTAKEAAKYARGHWSIENNCHWQLDITFNEDASTLRKDNAPANLAVIRKFALTLLKNESTKISLARKRKKANRNNDFLKNILEK